MAEYKVSSLHVFFSIFSLPLSLSHSPPPPPPHSLFPVFLSPLTNPSFSLFVSLRYPLLTVTVLMKFELAPSQRPRKTRGRPNTYKLGCKGGEREEREEREEGGRGERGWGEGVEMKGGQEERGYTFHSSRESIQSTQVTHVRKVEAILHAAHHCLLQHMSSLQCNGER